MKQIKAPLAGTVQQLALHTIGGMIQPGQELMVIVPDDSGIEVEAMVQNQDIGFVHDGDEAVIKFEAFPFTRYGTVPGKIRTVSEDVIASGNNSTGAFAQERSGQAQDGAQWATQNQLFYAARVSLNETTMNVDGKAMRLAPGMAATVEIMTGNES